MKFLILVNINAATFDASQSYYWLSKLAYVLSCLLTYLRSIGCSFIGFLSLQKH